jgi:hypothetical protein
MEDRDDTGPRQTSRGWTPDPDPTLLTTEQSGLLREEMYRAVGNSRELTDARLQGLNTSVSDFHARIPNDIKESLAHLRELFVEKLAGLRDEANQKFSGIALQFSERDVRTTQASELNRTMVEQATVASKTAIDAAFLANQKSADANAEYVDKSITKSEAATKEAIVGMQALLTGSINDIRGQIAGLTSRLDRGEGADKGLRDKDFDRRGNIGMVVGIAAASATAISMIVGVVLFIATHVSAPAAAPAPVAYGSPTVVSPAVIPVQPK